MAYKTINVLSQEIKQDSAPSTPDPDYYVTYYDENSNLYRLLNDTGTLSTIAFIEDLPANNALLQFSTSGNKIVTLADSAAKTRLNYWVLSGSAVYYNGNVGINMIPDTVFSIADPTDSNFFWYDGEEAGITSDEWATAKTGGNEGFRFAPVGGAGFPTGVGRNLFQAPECLYSKNAYAGDVWASFRNIGANGGMGIYLGGEKGNGQIYLSGGRNIGGGADEHLNEEFRLYQKPDGTAVLANYCDGNGTSYHIYPYMDFAINNVSGGTSPAFRWFYEYDRAGGPKTVMRTNLYRQLFLYNTTDPARPTLVWEGGSGTGFWSYDINATIDASVTGSHVFQINSAECLHVGSFVGGWTPPSDSRLKKNILDYHGGLSAVLAMRPVEYDYIKTGKHAIGLVAQELEEILPELVGESKYFGETRKTIDYMGLVTVLVNSIKDLYMEVQTLKQQIQNG